MRACLDFVGGQGSCSQRNDWAVVEAGFAISLPEQVQAGTQHDEDDEEQQLVSATSRRGAVNR